LIITENYGDYIMQNEYLLSYTWKNTEFRISNPAG